MMFTRLGFIQLIINKLLSHTSLSFPIFNNSSAFEIHHPLADFISDIYILTMNDTFTLPVRSRPLGVSAGYTTDSYDSNTISGTQLSELNVQKRAPINRKKLENLENIRPAAS
jgi:hypothetical protein